jgi:MFS family permease
MDRKWWTLIAVCTGVFMLLMDVTIVNVALPDIQHAFGASLADCWGSTTVVGSLVAAAVLLAGFAAASGINSTLRQVGIATGVAALGSILASQLRGSVMDGLADTPLSGHAHAIAERVSSGDIGQAIAAAPASMGATVAHTAQAGFVDGLNAILLIGAIISLGAAVATGALIRQRDFVVAPDAAAAPAPA